VSKRTPPEPIHVFVSSDEDEFSDLRAELKELLGDVDVISSKRIADATDKKSAEAGYSQNLIAPEVLEYSPGADIDRKINMAMEKSQLYVGVFGREYSSTTVKEFGKAIDRGMTTLVYYFTEPPAPLKNKITGKSQSKFYDFLMEEIRPKVLIGGNYKSIKFKTRQELEDEIVVDVVAELTVMVRQYHGVQKAVTGFKM
jgi:hypothetical protein